MILPRTKQRVDETLTKKTIITLPWALIQMKPVLFMSPKARAKQHYRAFNNTLKKGVDKEQRAQKRKASVRSTP